MDVEFEDDDLDRLETDARFTAGFAQEVVRVDAGRKLTSKAG